MTTLTNLILQARERSDQVGSEFVSDAEATRIINLAAKEYRDLLISSGEDYFATLTSEFAIASTGVKAVEATFYKLIGVDLKVGSDWVPMHTYTWEERNRTSGPIKYRLVGSDLRYTPPALASGQYSRYWYVPKFTELSSGSDSLDDVNGWDNFVILKTAIAMANKEESDVSVLMAELSAMVQRLEVAKQNRDLGEPQRVQDVRSSVLGFDWEEIV